MISWEEVQTYARDCKRQRPQITEGELRAILEAKFIRGVDPFSQALARGLTIGAVNNPLDWLWGLSSILLGMARLWKSSGADVAAIKEIIEGVVIIVAQGLDKSRPWVSAQIILEPAHLRNGRGVISVTSAKGEVKKQSTLDLPASVKERLLELSRQLPDTTRGSFLSRTADRLAELADHHSNTLVLAAMGWLLGVILDHVFTVHVPFSELAICLTGGKISGIGLVAGALYGLSRDIQQQNIRAEVARVIGEELRRVLAVEGRT